jgi:hypothetical protein
MTLMKPPSRKTNQRSDPVKFGSAQQDSRFRLCPVSHEAASLVAGYELRQKVNWEAHSPKPAEKSDLAYSNM